MANFFEWVTGLFEWILALSLTGGIVYLCARLFEKPMILRMKKSWIYSGYRFLLTLWVIPYGCILWKAMKNTIHWETVHTAAYNIMENAFSTQKNFGMPQTFSSEGSDPLLSVLLPMVSVLWFAVMCVLLMRFLIFYVKQKRFLQKSAVENLWVKEQAQKIQATYKLGKDVEILINLHIKSPLLLGLWRHTILIPNLALNEGELEMILKHECIHLRRMDNVSLWIAQIIHCIHWFNPLAYLFQKEMERFCEDSCDEQVISHMDDGQRKQYGLTILKVLEQTANKGEGKIKAISALNSQYKRMEERIQNIVIRQKERKLRSALWIICLAIVISLYGSMIASALTVPEPQNWWEGGIGSPMAGSYEVNGKTIEMENKNGSFVPAYPYIQVTYTNNGAGQAQIFIEDNEGIPIDSGVLTVEPGKTNTLTLSDPVKPGQKRFYNVCSKNGETKVDGILTVRTAKKREAFADPYDVNTTLTRSTKNGSFVPQNPYVKVYYKNGASSSSKVFIRDSEGNPLPNGKGIFTVEKGGDAYITLELTAGARYHYNVTTSNGADPISGTLVIRSASTKSGIAALFLLKHQHK